MPPQKYPKPPITEAIVELRFSTNVDRDILEKMTREVRAAYPTAEQSYAVDFEFKVTAAGKEPEVRPNKTRLEGFRLTGKEGTDLLLLSAGRLATIRLAPYEGWEPLFERVQSNYEKLRKVAGYRGFTRVATRYINRIDIPREGREKVDTAEYLLTEPRIPPRIPSVSHFHTRFTGPVPAIDATVIVNANILPVSPLIDHLSLGLDIDLYKDHDLPQKESEVWDLLNALRVEKNALFENLITDQARRLFERA